jgi:hypothetical protein
MLVLANFRPSNNRGVESAKGGEVIKESINSHYKRSTVLYY